MKKNKKGQRITRINTNDTSEILFEIPKNWKLKTLNDVAEYKKGPFGSSITKAMFVPKGKDTFKVYEQGNAIRKTINYGDYYISKSKFEELKSFSVIPGDIIISCAGTIGEVYKLPDKCEKGVINQALMRVRIKKCIEEKFFILFFSEILKTDIINKSKGTAIINIPPFSVMKTIPIPLPPLAEQKRIVKRIESLFAKLYKAKELAQNALDSFENGKAAILHKAFSGELTAKWRKEHGVGIDSWKETILAKNVSILGDGLHGTPKYNDNGDYYFINGNNLSGNSIIIKQDTKKVDKEEYKKHKKELNNKTVFVSINGTLGNTAFYNNEPVILGKSACYFNVLNSLNKYFIRYYLETKAFLNYANITATGSTIKNLSLKAMRNLPIHLPTLAEQKEIVRILDCLFKKEKRARDFADVVGKIDVMKKAILARAFRGELGTGK